MARRKRGTPGVVVRHSRACRTAAGGVCSCSPSYRAWVYDRRAGKKIVCTFPNLDEAKAWRADAFGEVRRGKRRAVEPRTLREVAAEWMAEAEAGRIRRKGGDTYKPSALRGYRIALRLYLLPELGHLRVSDVTVQDVQRVVDRLLAPTSERPSLSASTARNAVMPLRRIWPWLVRQGYAAMSPLEGLDLPAVRGRRDRIAEPAEAARLIAALPEEDRALWATAVYAGLRLGELRALDWSDVDLDAGTIRVRRGWDPIEGPIAPKSEAGTRTVPLGETLRPFLRAHRLRTGRSWGLVFGRTPSEPFATSSVTERAKRTWEAAGLEPVTLHELRHTFASYMIAAGVDFKKLSAWMGHSSIVITLDRYGHLLPGDEADGAAALDAYLARA